jgi:hypothetical protein
MTPETEQKIRTAIENLLPDGTGYALFSAPVQRRKSAELPMTLVTNVPLGGLIGTMAMWAVVAKEQLEREA